MLWKSCSVRSFWQKCQGVSVLKKISNLHDTWTFDISREPNSAHCVTSLNQWQLPCSQQWLTALELGWSKDVIAMGLPSIYCNIREKESYDYWLRYNYSWYSLMKRRAFIHLLLWMSRSSWSRVSWTIFMIMFQYVRLAVVNTYNFLLISGSKNSTAVCSIQLDGGPGKRRESQDFLRPWAYAPSWEFGCWGSGQFWASAAGGMHACCIKK